MGEWRKNMKKCVSLSNLFENGIPCLEFGGTIKFHGESDNDYDLINDTTQEVIIRNNEQLEFGEWCHDEADGKFIVGTSDSGKNVYFSKEEYVLAVAEKQSIELGKEYLFAGYKWTACEMINDGKTVVLQSHGVTVGAWPGYKMLKFGSKIDRFYASDIDGEDISAYDDKMQALYDTIKEVEDTSASYGKGLYLISKEKTGYMKWGNPGSGFYWQTLKTVTKYARSLGTSHSGAWIGTYNGSYSAWYVNSGDIYNYDNQSYDFVVAPAFNLDLSKVEICDDEIVIIDGEKSQTSQAFGITLVEKPNVDGLTKAEVIYERAVSEKRTIELGKEYLFAGYKWVPVEINENWHVAVMQSLGVTAGPWPGFSMENLGDGKHYAHNIDEYDISRYDDKIYALMKQIKPVSLIDGLYLPGLEDINDNQLWKDALARAASRYSLFGASYHYAWTGTYNGGNGAWIVNSNGNTDGGNQGSSYVVPVAFNLDLSKVEIRDDEIIIIENDNTDQSKNPSNFAEFMTNELAKNIITEYVFADYDISSIYKFLNTEASLDESEKRLYSEALLTMAMQKAVIALTKPV